MIPQTHEDPKCAVLSFLVVNGVGNTVVCVALVLFFLGDVI